MASRNIQLNRYFVIIAQAMVIAGTFPGITIEAHESKEWTYNLRSLDVHFNRDDVGIESLVNQVSDLVTELKSFYGEDGDGMWDGFLPGSGPNVE